MVYRLIIAKVNHNRLDEFVDLVKGRWAPLLEEHGGKLLGVMKSAEPTEHEVVGIMRFESMEDLTRINQELAKDNRFRLINEKMRPMLLNNEIRLLVTA